MSSSWADRNHNCVRLDHAVLLGQFTSHTGDRMYERKATWVPWPHPCWTVALLKIKTLLLGITTLWHGSGGAQESSLDNRQLDQMDHHSSQAFKLKQSRHPLTQALNIMNSSDPSFFSCMGSTWLKAETFLDYCAKYSRTLLYTNDT